LVIGFVTITFSIIFAPYWEQSLVMPGLLDNLIMRIMDVLLPFLTCCWLLRLSLFGTWADKRLNGHHDCGDSKLCAHRTRQCLVC